MTVKPLARRGLAPRLAVLCLPVAAALVFPSVALAASGGNTVRATIGGDGAVKSVKMIAADGTSSAYTGSVPLTLSISRTVSGNTSTYSYDVENTFSKEQTVSYTDTAGHTHTTSTTLQLPLVAQLGVQIPNTYKNIQAPGGVVTIDPDGTARVLYNLVMFSPLGSPSQTVTFTATGSGAPMAELAATTVNPSTTSGLSSASQDANSTSQQDDFWKSFASGGDGGLTQLATGMSQMIVGLNQLSPGAHQLADGIKKAGDGAVLLDNGTAAAYKGSKDLSSGIGQIHTGQASLTDGLTQIHDGIALLDDKSGKGVQAAVDGIKQIEAGVEGLLVGLQGYKGTPTVPTDIVSAQGADEGPSILKGFLTAQGAIHPLITPLQTDLGTLAAMLDPTSLAFDAGFATLASTDGALATLLTHLETDLGTAVLPASQAALLFPDPTDPRHGGGALVQVDAGMPTLIGGLQLVTSHLDHGTGPNPDPTGVVDPTGVDGGLLLLLDPVKGLPAAVTGLDLLNTGSGAALSGSTKLTDGSGAALTGSQKLASGLGQLATGQHQVATGLPAAVSGSAQIAGGIDAVLSGAQKVHDGILAVQSGAVAPLEKQLTDGSLNAKKQLAILDAAGSLAAQAPGGTNATYVLSQSTNGFRLAADLTPTKTKSSSDTGRNIGIALGGVAALIVAVVAGFALGRRSAVVTV